MIELSEAQTDSDLKEIRRLFVEYADGLGIDLCFQNFEQELASLPGCYARPKGFLLLARENDQPAGCVALRPMDHGICEMKRLYVRPAFQGKRIGIALTKSIIEKAKLIGYRQMRLDTLPSMKAAVTLYESLGFEETEAYYDNPLSGVRYLQLSLSESSKRKAAAEG
ncbi:MAG: GNAT family N-acetyltransferase [Phycisphaerales bacterium]|nr:GNAT family N-acetyltransferase [Phycisphaerales bacterium]